MSRYICTLVHFYKANVEIATFLNPIVNRSVHQLDFIELTTEDTKILALR